MEFKQLESYAAVVHCKSFTKAAQQLYISQPTISTHIQSLEAELGVRLIIRTTKSIEITPQGQTVYEHAVNLLEMRDRMLADCKPDTKQIIHLGASTIPSAYILPEVLPQFGKVAPNTFFVIHQSDSQATVSGVLDGVFDLGLVGAPSDSANLICEPFCSDRMTIITPVNEHFLQLKSLPDPPLEALLQEPIILREQGSGSKKSADLFLEKMGLTDDKLLVTARVNDPEAIKNLVAGGLGISIISQRAARNFLQEKRLLQFDLPAFSNTRNLYLIYRRDLDSRRDLREFIGFLREFYAGEDLQL